MRTSDSILLRVSLSCSETSFLRNKPSIVLDYEDLSVMRFLYLDEFFDVEKKVLALI